MPRVLTAVLGDLVAYLTAYRANEFFSLREEIRRRCYGLCRDVLRRTDSHGQPYYDHVVFVGHSLGSVIVYDVLNRILGEDRLADPAKKGWARIRGLVTLGSPLNKSAFLFGYESDRDFDVRTRIHSGLQPLISLRELREEVPWINFWSRFDPVSACLGYYEAEADAKGWSGRILNIHDRRAAVPLFAHITYWKNPDLGEILRMLCQPAVCEIAAIRRKAEELGG